MMEITLTITIDERKLKLLKMFHNSGQHESFQIKTDAELIEHLINEAYRQMKTDPVGKKLLY